MLNRLDEYLENNNIICPEQKSFKKGMRTSDHNITLKTLILINTLRKISMCLPASLGANQTKMMLSCTYFPGH
jgi:hypothetical protein